MLIPTGAKIYKNEKYRKKKSIKIQGEEKIKEIIENPKKFNKNEKS